jgi:HSP20 family protein
MYETNGHLVVKSALPGVKSDDIDINIQDDRLVIKGEFKTDKEQDKGDIHYQERRYGRFHRSIPLPGSIDIEAVDAEFEDGILKITFPRPEESKTKRIEIKKS